MAATESAFVVSVVALHASCTTSPRTSASGAIRAFAWAIANRRASRSAAKTDGKIEAAIVKFSAETSAQCVAIKAQNRILISQTLHTKHSLNWQWGKMVDKMRRKKRNGGKNVICFERCAFGKEPQKVTAVQCTMRAIMLKLTLPVSSFPKVGELAASRAAERPLVEINRVTEEDISHFGGEAGDKF